MLALGPCAGSWMLGAGAGCESGCCTALGGTYGRKVRCVCVLCVSSGRVWSCLPSFTPGPRSDWLVARSRQNTTQHPAPPQHHPSASSTLPKLLHQPNSASERPISPCRGAAVLTRYSHSTHPRAHSLTINHPWPTAQHTVPSPVSPAFTRVCARTLYAHPHYLHTHHLPPARLNHDAALPSKKRKRGRQLWTRASRPPGESHRPHAHSRTYSHALTHDTLNPAVEPS